ncbi:hypothetical protein CYLTODRAFT_422376 [Cylindrobasidium torrendii FP15055 ss-10]|uniref:Uncharacterized protein n=1 Tax=Cylindrobasidium torrendii FP15055 ss-10 TaxID=1314674 RepID=A0A0D7BBM2_9AGAR|nr:hypothetical protein CYLTODRAFT_422376 [Cylindrobasidium torrendii FP15055 ss-10]
MSLPVDLYNVACDLVTQPPPPTLREILNAYRSKGDGDREMLLALLNAKSAEQTNHTTRSALCQRLIEGQQPDPSMEGHYYPSPAATRYSPPLDERSITHPRHDRRQSRRHTSPYSRHSPQSPHRRLPSPYSSASSSDSSIPDSPISGRANMSIGSLLSSSGSDQPSGLSLKHLSEAAEERTQRRDYP